MGHVILCLIGNEHPPAEKELYNEDINELILHADQPSLKEYQEKDLLMVWDQSPNNFQKQRIAEIITDSYYRNGVYMRKRDGTYNSAGEIERKGTPLSRSLKKLKVDTIYQYYSTSQEYGPDAKEDIKNWKQKQQGITGFSCSLL